MEDLGATCDCGPPSGDQEAAEKLLHEIPGTPETVTPAVGGDGTAEAAHITAAHLQLMAASKARTVIRRSTKIIEFFKVIFLRAS